MPQTAEFLIAIGSILLLGLATDFLGKRTFLPRVTLLLIFGIIIGDEVLAVIPHSVTSRFEIITNIALLMIGFLLGGKLTLKSFKTGSRQILLISLTASIGAAVLISLALIAIGMSIEIAILLGCIAAATDPAATVATIQETNSKSEFSRLLLAIVAIDDAWALILFSLGLALVSLFNGGQDGATHLYNAAYEIFGALLIGTIIGIPAAYLTGRVKYGQPMLTEALGLVFICGGLSLWLEVSFLIAAMTMGAIVANLARHHDYAFHEIENIEGPFLILFFILAGATLEISLLAGLGFFGLVYILTRIAGKVLGAWLGASLSDASMGIKQWTGIALMPQAGVAIGMALLIANKYPEFQQTVLSIVISTTVFFELIGPILTRLAIKKNM